MAEFTALCGFQPSVRQFWRRKRICSLAQFRWFGYAAGFHDYFFVFVEILGNAVVEGFPNVELVLAINYFA